MNRGLRITTLVGVVILLFIRPCVIFSQYTLDSKCSEYAYLYPVDKQEMKALVLQKVDTLSLHSLSLSPVDSCYVSKIDTFNCGVGQWVWVWRDGAKLGTKLVNNTSFKVDIYGENNGIIQVHITDLDSNPIPNAKVKLGKHRLKYNDETGFYECKAFHGRRLCLFIVEIDNEISSFTYQVTKENYFKNYGTRYAEYRRELLEKNRYLYSYFLTDKPKYRPGEVVNWKALVIDKSGKWVDRKLQLVLQSSYSSYRKVLDLVEPVKPGVYAGQFLLADSLQLTANSTYSLSLSNEKGSVSSKFYLEDYQLEGMKINVISSDTVLVGDTCWLTISAVDEKNDNITSGRAKIRLRPGHLSYIKDTYLFVSDNLLDTTVALSSSGQAIVPILTDKFPCAVMDVNWSVEVVSDIYETASQYGSFVLSYDKNLARSGNITSYPSISINRYEVADSVGFSVVNDSNIYFRYAVYKDNNILVSGYDNKFNWKEKASAAANYYIAVNYDYGNVSDRIEHHDTELKVRVVQPGEVEPGDSAFIQLYVTDNKGLPVEGADITAFSQTSKFNQQIPLPTKWKFRGRRACSFSAVLMSPTYVDLEQQYINLPLLQELFTTSESDYYKLLTPEYNKPFILEKTIPGEAQVSPFIIKDGEVQPVEIVYIDSKPVYVGWSTNLAPYSFSVKPGSHDISIRTSDALYTIKDVDICQGRKMWLSVAAYDKKHKDVGRESVISRAVMPSFLTPTEAAYFARWCTMRYKVFPQRGLPFVLLPDSQVVSLEHRLKNYNGDEGLALINGFNGWYCESSLDSVSRLLKWRFLPNSTSYIIPSQNLMIGKTDCVKHVKQQLGNSLKPSVDDSLLTVDVINNRWQKEVDEKRYHSYFIWGKQSDSIGNCSLRILLPDDSPLNVQNILVEDDSICMVSGGYRTVYRNLFPHKYKVTLLFLDNSMVSEYVTLKPGGENYLSICSKKRVITDESISLSDSIRHYTERYMSLYAGDDFEVDWIFGDNGLKETISINTPRKKSSFSERNNKVMMSAPDMAIRGTNVVENAVEEEVLIFENEVIDLSAMEAEGASIVGQMRTDFSDVAYWKPFISTDSDGKASFWVKYPDDLTRWNEYFIAMKGKSRGYAQSTVVTRRNLVATLAVPRFAVEGDSVVAIGQCIDYSGNSVGEIRPNFTYNDTACNLQIVSLADNSLTAVSGYRIPHGLDSLSVTYSIDKNNVFIDGEQRDLPIYPQGVELVEGVFHLLSADTSVVISPIDGLEPMSLTIMGDMMALLIDDVKSLQIPKYQTNDMLASSLLALVSQQRICEILGEKFAGGKLIRSTIKKLENNCQDDFMWSWMGSSGKTSVWITEHVYSALQAAYSLGYEVALIGKKEMIVNHLVKIADYYNERRNYDAMLHVSSIVSVLGYFNVARGIVSEIDIDSLYFNSRLLHHIVSSRVGLYPDISELDSIRHLDILGGESYMFDYKINPLWRNTAYSDYYRIAFPTDYLKLHTTLQVFELLSVMPVSAERDLRMKAVSRWLLRQRCESKWYNSYMAVKVVNSLLPYSVVNRGVWRPSSVTVGDNVYDKFPVVVKNIDHPVRVSASGSNDIYVSGVQRYFVREPKYRSAEFSINTHWTEDTLSQGKISDLIVTVDITKDADYLVINVPIPAGCVYVDYQPYTKGEVHREMLKNGVNIYCDKLNAGTHIFKVKLLPRFTGKYTLNPAKVEMIYFPVFNANNEISSVTIGAK